MKHKTVFRFFRSNLQRKQLETQSDCVAEDGSDKGYVGSCVSEGMEVGNLDEACSQEQEVRRSTNAFIDNVATNILNIVKNGTKSDEQTISEIVANVRAQVEQGDAEETASLREIIRTIDEYKEKLGDVCKKYVGHINFRKISPTAVLYYLEHEDERKNPSWQRRQHRFLPGVNISTIHQLNDFLDLALLSYADSADAISEGLDKFKTPYDLVYASLRSYPGKPANFVAVRRNQESSHPLKKTSPNLYVVIGVRGTKSAADAITDLLCDTIDYRGGKAHSFILESGKYIASQHLQLLEDLRIKAGKKHVKVTLVGHSLGAGAATIAGMELQNVSPKLKVQHVYGFGTPAIVSPDLAEAVAPYVTTIVNDTDVVPRMSGISLANLLITMMKFNWVPYAKTDIRCAIAALQKRHSSIFRETTAKKILQTIDPLLERYMKATILKESPQLLEPEVFPPGKCIHFYRDGSGFSSAVVSNDYFSEIDVSRRMIDDHVFHSGYQKTLLEIARGMEKDHHFRFDG